MKIIVLAGGLSSERNVSFSSGAKVTQTLLGLGHQAALVDLFLGLEDYSGPPEGIFDAPPPLPPANIGAQAPDLEAVRASRRDRSPGIFGPGVLTVCGLADLVFLALHGQCGEDGRVQAAFDLMGIPYTGSGYLGSAIAMDKCFTKDLVRSGGGSVRTPASRVFAPVTREDLETARQGPFPGPQVVKDPRGGSSIGVDICPTREEYIAALTRRLGEKALAESFVSGREFSCGVLEDRALPPIEIIPREGFYDYANKYQPGATTEVCPAPLSPAQTEAIQRAALEIHRLLGLAVYSRSDFILGGDGQFYFLEVNTLPGMTPTSLLPQEAAAVGVDYPHLCETIIRASLDARRAGK